MIESPALDEVKEIIRQRTWAEATASTELDVTRRNTIDNLELRFGTVPTSIAEKLAEVKEATRLRELFKVSVTCPTLEAFETAISSK